SPHHLPLRPLGICDDRPGSSWIFSRLAFSSWALCALPADRIGGSLSLRHYTRVCLHRAHPEVLRFKRRAAAFSAARSQVSHPSGTCLGFNDLDALTPRFNGVPRRTPPLRVLGC